MKTKFESFACAVVLTMASAVHAQNAQIMPQHGDSELMDHEPIGGTDGANGG